MFYALLGSLLEVLVVVIWWCFGAVRSLGAGQDSSSRGFSEIQPAPELHQNRTRSVQSLVRYVTSWSTYQSSGEQEFAFNLLNATVQKWREFRVFSVFQFCPCACWLACALSHVGGGFAVVGIAACCGCSFSSLESCIAPFLVNSC